ncbi:MAG TPA: S41 family peptidase [Ferruginibacter sp.]|nr:S41 family peptidase [Ferruginibacter sp.]HMP20179.1 S41 family peptidase [Ferruginibacter sp.]
MSELTNRKKIQVWTPLLFSIALAIGMLLGYKMRDDIPGRNFFSSEKPGSVQEILTLIQKKYVDKVSANELADTAITAILAKLDPHSVYIPADELQSANDDLAGGYSGIGVEFEMINDTINIVHVMPDGPSFKAGIKTGDKLIKANDSVLAGVKISYKRIKKILRGKDAVTIQLEVLRGSTAQKIAVTRGIVKVSTIDAAYIIADSTGYIRLNKFTQVSYREFMQALEALQAKGISKLILDLRGNGGGVLDEATAIADEFLDGDKLITYTEGENFAKKEYRCKRPGLFEKGKLVVLADESSASASEVLMGALQDWDRATIIGRRSFGKGLVQEQYSLKDGSALRLTVARYYTPVGRSIQRPYDAGQAAYYHEIANRFYNGEVVHADSLKFDSSLLFKTVQGRKVFGGGGIYPDVFVPADTNIYGAVCSKMYAKNITGLFAYKYQLTNSDKLSRYTSPATFATGFSFTETDWQQLLLMTAKDSIQPANITAAVKDRVLNCTKAALARQLWRNQGYYEIANRNDKVIKKALEILAQ